jgi:DnaK suppressor protein
MTLPHHDLEYFRLQLDAKRIELSGPHNAEGIAFEPTADSMDETVLANERDLIVDRLNREASVFRQVAAALDRIAAGEFGICLECGESIPRRRLAALPWAALCLECQEAADRKPKEEAKTRRNSSILRAA